MSPLEERLADPVTVSAVQVLAGLAIGAAAVVAGDFWRATTHVVVIVHELGHVLVARLSGGRPDGVRLHRDSSGVAHFIVGGVGAYVATWAGYFAPSAVGVALLWAAANGYAPVALVAALIGLAGTFILIRTLWGVFTVLMSAAAVVGVLWHGAGNVMFLAVWITGAALVAGGLRDTVEQWQIVVGGGSDAGDTDAGALADTVPLPKTVYAAVHVAGSVVAAACGVAVAAGFVGATWAG